MCAHRCKVSLASSKVARPLIDDLNFLCMHVYFYWIFTFVWSRHKYMYYCNFDWPYKSYDLAVQVASKSLMDTLNEMYESQWVGHDHMCTDSNNLDMLWSDYTHKLADQVLIPLNTYQAQFAETRVSNCTHKITCITLHVAAHKCNGI